VTDSFKAYNDEKSVIGWHLYIKDAKTQLWDLVFNDEEHRFDNNDDGEPMDPDEGVDTDPLGKLIRGEEEEDEGEEGDEGKSGKSGEAREAGESK
jgi:hypothetical protein